MNRRRFWEFVCEAQPAEPFLPLMHTTRGAEFRSIAERSMLEPQEKLGDQDPFPSERLVYFFYGRPVFRDDFQRDTAKAMFLPVALIIRPEAIAKIRRVFPFDSGAAHKNFYEGHISKPLQWRDLELASSLEAAARMVSRFFGTNEGYVLGKRRDGLNIPAMNFEADSYYQLAGDATCRADDRRFTAELQVEVEHGLVLGPDTVLAVILPGIFLEDAEIKETILGNWKAKILPYPTYGGRIGECYKNIMDLAAEYMRDGRFIHPSR